MVTQDPAFGGGGAAHANAFADGARGLGREVEVLWVPHPVLAGKRFTLDRLEAWRQLRGGRRLARRLSGAGPLWVVTTMAHSGFAAVASGSSYACWICTTVDEEWAGRRRGLGAARRWAFELSLPALRHLERRVLRGAQRVYATSPRARDAVARAGGLDVSQVGVLPIPVDVERFTPEPDDEWSARLDRPVLAFVGRANDPRKNVQLLLDAMPLLRERVPGATLRLIGEPPSGPLPAGVEATGVVDDVAAHLRSASLFVLPSRQEGFGIVAVEAMACGVPVLTTPSFGTEEIVDRSRAGRILETFEPQELATAAAELLEDVGTLATMRSRGREYVEREHAPTVFRRQLERALSEPGD